MINGAWHFWPVVLNEKVVGVSARRTDTFNPKFIEVFSSVGLVESLGIMPLEQVAARVLPGRLLPLSG